MERFENQSRIVLKFISVSFYRRALQSLPMWRMVPRSTTSALTRDCSCRRKWWVKWQFYYQTQQQCPGGNAAYLKDNDIALYIFRHLVFFPRQQTYFYNLSSVILGTIDPFSLKPWAMDWVFWMGCLLNREPCREQYHIWGPS